MSSLPTAPTTIPTLASTLANYFDPAKSTVKPKVANAGWKQLAFGRQVPDVELAGLCGAPNGSTIELFRSSKPTDPNVEQTPDGVLAVVTNPAFFAHPTKLIFHSLPSGGCGVYVNLVVAAKHPTLTCIAGLMLSRMLEQMDAVPPGAAPFEEMTMLAAGGRCWLPMNAAGERWSGWVVWPKYGFDMPVQPITTNTFPAFQHVPAFKNAPNKCANVSDLLTLDKGPEFWEVVGDGHYMSFDTAPGSRHRSTLAAFMKRKYK
jgi:hypothetical protein